MNKYNTFCPLQMTFYTIVAGYCIDLQALNQIFSSIRIISADWLSNFLHTVTNQIWNVVKRDYRLIKPTDDNTSCIYVLIIDVSTYIEEW